MKFRDFHPEARLELRDSVAFYQHATPGIALDFDRRVDEALTQIEEHPARYSYWQQTEVRRYVLRGFPYVIFFLEYSDRSRVLALARTSRRPGCWKKRITVD